MLTINNVYQIQYRVGICWRLISPTISNIMTEKIICSSMKFNGKHFLVILKQALCDNTVSDVCAHEKRAKMKWLYTCWLTLKWETNIITRLLQNIRNCRLEFFCGQMKYGARCDNKTFHFLAYHKLQKYTFKIKYPYETFSIFDNYLAIFNKQNVT